MAKLIHTVKLNNPVMRGYRMVRSTRTTTGRRYVAALVVTVTKITVERAEAERHVAQGRLAVARAELEALLGETGLTVETAAVQDSAAFEAWYDATAAARRDLVAERGCERNRVWKQAEALVIASGIPDYRTLPAHRVVTLIGQVEILEVEAVRDLPVVGSQFVMSWHQTLALALKASGAAAAQRERDLGNEVAIRTEIEVREVAPRSAKSK